jgi:glycosyltransferase involved in cell wall biosynthesis/Flp pilus assembly protein TadD
MVSNSGVQKKLALVYGTLPSVEEIDQFLLTASDYEVTVITSESIVGYLTQTSRYDQLTCIALPDHSENTTYLPGLEKVLQGFDIVVVKERLGMYAYQAVKAKWRSRFRLIIWVDNLTPMPGEDITHMRTIRSEVGNAADAFLVQTESARQALLIEGVDSQRILSFSPFVEQRIQRQAKTRARAIANLGLADTDFVIAHFGQIEWEESLLDLVHAMKLIEFSDKSLAARIKLVFCGIGSFSAEIRDRLVTLGLDRQAVYAAPSRDAFQEVLTAADCFYYSPTASRDRIDGDPYRLMIATANGVPVIAARGPLVEETIGKHRFDFCPGSPESLAKAIRKAASTQSLRIDIAAKNLQQLKSAKPRVTKEMLEVFQVVNRQTPTIDVNALDHQVLEVEAQVHAKQYLAAIDVIESIFQLKDIPIHHKANLYRLIGDCFTKLGDGEAGKQAYQQAIEFDPYASRAYIGLGTVSLTRNSFDTAVLQFQKAVSLAPEDEMANLGLGLAFQGMGELNESSRWVVKSLECNPENTAALFTLVQIAGERGKFSEVQQALATYIGLHPHDHNMLYTLAVIKFKVGDNQAAKSLVDRIVSIDPYNERAQALSQQIARLTDPAAGTLNA